MNKTGRIKSRSGTERLRVVQTSKGVFWDKERVDDGSRTFFISTTPTAARRLAQWILDNVTTEEE